MQEDFYQNTDEKQVLEKAKDLGIKDALQEKNDLVPIATEDAIFIFFVENGTYSYVRINDPRRNWKSAMGIINSFAEKQGIEPRNIPVARMNGNGNINK